MNKNTNVTIVQLSLWLGIPALILGIMSSIHALLKDSLLELLKKLSFETISLLILILLSCLVVTVTCILYLCKKLKESKPDSKTLDISPLLEEAKDRMKQVNKINLDDYRFIKDPGYFSHKVNGGEFCHPCLISNPPVVSPLTEPNEGEWVCNKCNKTTYTKENIKESHDEIKRLNNIHRPPMT